MPSISTLWIAARRRIGEADVVVGRDQEAGRPGGRVVDGLADLGIDDLDDGADDVARRAELAQLARLLDLLEDVLEEIALGVGVGAIEPQTVHQGHDLREHGRLVDARDARRA